MSEEKVLDARIKLDAKKVQKTWGISEKEFLYLVENGLVSYQETETGELAYSTTEKGVEAMRHQKLSEK